MTNIQELNIVEALIQISASLKLISKSLDKINDEGLTVVTSGEIPVMVRFEGVPTIELWDRKVK